MKLLSISKPLAVSAWLAAGLSGDVIAQTPAPTASMVAHDGRVKMRAVRQVVKQRSPYLGQAGLVLLANIEILTMLVISIVLAPITAMGIVSFFPLLCQQTKA